MVASTKSLTKTEKVVITFHISRLSRLPAFPPSTKTRHPKSTIIKKCGGSSVIDKKEKNISDALTKMPHETPSDGWMEYYSVKGRRRLLSRSKRYRVYIFEAFLYPPYTTPRCI